MVFDIKQNPNEDELKEIIEAVDANEGYCPCALEKNPDTKCMCKEFRDNEDTDFCHCGRFYKVRDYETLALIGDVSEEDESMRYMEWYERLIYQDFVITGIPLSLYDINYNSNRRKNLYRSIIAKSDAVLVLGHSQELSDLVLELIEWAGSIGKKVLTREDLVK
jgi:hypothetical protein